MREHFREPAQLFAYQLGSALMMEHDSLAMLAALATAARSEQARDLFERHLGETRGQAARLERAYLLLDLERTPHPSPASDTLLRDSREMLKRADPALVDLLALSAALGAEHHEIATYQTLIAATSALGAAEVTELLEESLAEERRASEVLADAVRRAAHELAAVPVGGRA